LMRKAARIAGVTRIFLLGPRKNHENLH
jgi:hypothetical protein